LLDVSWAPAPAENTAIIVDLPGKDSVELGVSLAQRGYRPVPLYNACPGPAAVVQLEDIMEGLVQAGPMLEALRIDAHAPPAFLLDSGRTRADAPVAPGRFDNRWVVFPQDFPSANLLLSAGIMRVLLLRREAAHPADDLAHVLRRWQESGLIIMWADPYVGARPEAVIIRRPRHFRWIWYRTLALIGLRRNSAGGFGSVVPQPSSGGGFA
jgi:hypothetical protein